MFPLFDRQVPHIADQIFRYLDFEDYLAVRVVCKEWREYIEQHCKHLCTCNQEKEGSWRHMLSVISTWKDLKRMFKMSFSGPTPKLVTMKMPEQIHDACSSNLAGRIHVVTQRSIIEIDIVNMTMLEELIFPQEHQKKYTFGLGISANLNEQHYYYVREGQQQHRFKRPMSGNCLEYVNSSPIDVIHMMTQYIMNYEEEIGLHVGQPFLFNWQNRIHNGRIIEEFCKKYIESRPNVKKTAHDLYFINNTGQCAFIFCLAEYNIEWGDRITYNDKTYVSY